MTLIIGLDPSSRKLAFVVTGPAIESSQVDFIRVTKIVQRCRAATDAVHRLIERYAWMDGAKYVFIESPVYTARAGARSLIPQATVFGAILAAFARHHQYIVEPVNNTVWKKGIVGSGNASKRDVGVAVEHLWPSIYRTIAGDQDLLDAAAIALYGKELLRKGASPPSSARRMAKARRLRRHAPRMVVRE